MEIFLMLLVNSVDLFLPKHRNFNCYQFFDANRCLFVSDDFAGSAKTYFVGYNFALFSECLFNNTTRNYHKVFQKRKHFVDIFDLFDTKFASLLSILKL